MKKTDFIYKTIQLVLYLLLTAVCLGLILPDRRLYHLVASDPSVRILCICLWLVLGMSFLFIYRDFNFFPPVGSITGSWITPSIPTPCQESPIASAVTL